VTALGTPEIWFDATERERAPQDVLAPIAQAPVTGVLLRGDGGDGAQLPARLRRAWVVSNGAPADARADDLLVAASPSALARVPEWSGGIGVRCAVRDHGSLMAACEMAASADYVFVRFDDETNIPLELILARAQLSGARIIKGVATVEDALVALGVLERGCHGIVFTTSEVAIAARFADALARRATERVALTEAEIVRLEHIGMGYRACVDTTSLLSKDEGMIVGSTSSGGLLACAEVHHLPYMNTRPFRVNAGAVHSYIWGPGGMAEYLSDLRAGSAVLVTALDGAARPVSVGRVKIEVRPLVLVEASAAGVPINLIVQDDWHVRLFGARGEARNVTTLAPGDRVLAHVCEPGRHVGIKVSETIVER
jgi:3-dehydroquinate synthase II/3-amino-4-hydroxybenzoic acid synthase